jgi:hypothetical protein
MGFDGGRAIAADLNGGRLGNGAPFFAHRRVASYFDDRAIRTKGILMRWFAKGFERGALWASDQDRFESLMTTIAAKGGDDYLKILMVTLDKDDQSGAEWVYLRMPEPYAAMFPGYEPANAPQAATSLLVGSQPEFERLFRS